MSAISILGIPSETYTFGFMPIFIVPAFIPAMYLAGYVYIPVFYNLKLTSSYEVRNYLDSDVTNSCVTAGVQHFL